MLTRAPASMYLYPWTVLTAMGVHTDRVGYTTGNCLARTGNYIPFIIYKITNNVRDNTTQIIIVHSIQSLLLI